MPDGQTAPRQRSILWVALGRQRVGKPAVLNAAVQYVRDLGSEIEVWNADQQNRSHSLSTFFPDALTPEGDGLEDGKAWIEERLTDLAARPRHVVLDAGGGTTAFTSLVNEVRILDMLRDSGVAVIGLFVVGPEKADLDYLDDFSRNGSFLPPATIIVTNAGLVRTSRSSKAAFAATMRSPVLQAAIDRGARTAMFPLLTCMAEVTDRGVTFPDAAAGIVRPGQAPFSLFDPVRVRDWWENKIPAFFEELPIEWLPIDDVAQCGEPGEQVHQS